MRKAKAKAKTVTMPTSVKIKGRTVKPMYNTSEITNRTNANLWVTFVSGAPTKGLVYSSTLSRDEARNASSRMFGTSIQNIRSQRVKTFRKNS